MIDAELDMLIWCVFLHSVTCFMEESTWKKARVRLRGEEREEEDVYMIDLQQVFFLVFFFFLFKRNIGLNEASLSPDFPPHSGPGCHGPEQTQCWRGRLLPWGDSALWRT